MVKSKAKNVDDYLDELSPERRSAISNLRQITKDVLPDFEESTRFGMPTYDGNGQVFAFASQKNYIRIYVKNEDIIQKHKKDLGKATYGKNCIRYRHRADMPLEEIQKVISETYT